MRIESSLEIEAPLANVFAAFSDFEHASERISGIKKVEIIGNSEVGVGFRWRETREMFGKEATEEMEITAFDAPNAYVVEAESHGTHYISRFRFDQLGPTKTKVVWSFEGRPLSTVAKLMSPLGVLFKGATKKILEQDMLDLKAHVERQKVGSPILS